MEISKLSGPGETWDCLVLGAGAAGMASSVYLSRYTLKHQIFGEIPGGQFADAPVVENYPGFKSISGMDLVAAFQEHVESYEVKIRAVRIGEIAKEGAEFVAKTASGAIFRGKTLILAMGARHRPLNIPGEDRFLGKGVSYCATCDAPLFKGKEVAVVGGGNSAVTAATHLASFASRVYLIHRRGEYTATPIEIERMKSLPNVTEVLGNTVKEIQGKEAVERIVLSNPITQLPASQVTLSVSGLFIEIGVVPASSIARALGVEVDEGGYLKVDPTFATNVPGVFAAGDLALLPGAIPLRQIVTSAADGARAAAAVYQYLRRQHPAPDWS